MVIFSGPHSVGSEYDSNMFRYRSEPEINDVRSHSLHKFLSIGKESWQLKRNSFTRFSIKSTTK